MDGQNEMIEMKNMMAQNHATQIQTWENLRTTFGTGQRPGGIGPSGHVILIDATGQRHRMLLEQCQSLDVCLHSKNMCNFLKRNIRF